MSLAVWLVAAAIVLSSASCVDANSHSFDYDTSDLPALVANEDFRVGSVVDPDAGFSNVGAVTVDSEGTAYVIERQDAEVRVLDRHGALIGTIGRAGEGPGEFSRPDRLGFRGDTLWVNDPGLARVTMLSRDGEVLQTFPSLPLMNLESRSPSVIAFAHGGVLRSDGFVHMEEPSAVVMLGRGLPPESLAVPIVRVDRTATVRDTVGYSVLYLIPSEDEGSSGRPAQTDMLLDPGPPADSPLRARLDDGFVVVDRAASRSSGWATFAITRVSGSDTIYSSRMRYEPRRFEQAILDSLLKSSSIADVPVYQAPVTAMKVGDDNSVWLRREILLGSFASWLVVKADGKPLGHVQLPAEASVRWVSQHLIYTVERDQNDVPWLVRYSIGG